MQNIGTESLTGTVSAWSPFSIMLGGSYSLGDSQTQQVVVRCAGPLQERSQMVRSFLREAEGSRDPSEGDERKSRPPFG